MPWEVNTEQCGKYAFCCQENLGRMTLPPDLALSVCLRRKLITVCYKPGAIEPYLLCVFSTKFVISKDI